MFFLHLLSFLFSCFLLCRLCNWTRKKVFGHDVFYPLSMYIISLLHKFFYACITTKIMNEHKKLFRMKQKVGLYPLQKSLSAFQHSSWEAPVVQVAQRGLSQACDACGKSTYGNWCFSITNISWTHPNVLLSENCLLRNCLSEKDKES